MTSSVQIYQSELLLRVVVVSWIMYERDVVRTCARTTAAFLLGVVISLSTPDNIGKTFSRVQFFSMHAFQTVVASMIGVLPCLAALHEAAGRRSFVTARQQMHPDPRPVTRWHVSSGPRLHTFAVFRDQVITPFPPERPLHQPPGSLGRCLFEWSDWNRHMKSRTVKLLDVAYVSAQLLGPGPPAEPAQSADDLDAFM